MIRNSTIIPKKRKLACGCFDFNFSKNRCKAHATIDSTAKRIAAYEEMEQDENLSSLIDDLDVWFSKYIRLLYASPEGFVRCYTSGLILRWQDAHCGHFISRKNLATRWLPDNCRPQSEHQNCMLHGNLEVFKRKLEEEKSGITDWLEQQAREVCKPSREELKSLIIEYRHKVKLLEKKIKK